MSVDPDLSKILSRLKPSVGARVMAVLALMGVAEEAIALAQANAPDEAARARASGCFMALYPDAEFVGKAPLIYRAHCDELLARALAGTSLTLGTDAECLLAFSAQSLKHPLNGTGCAAFELMFVSVMGEPVPGERTHEAYDGAAAELIAGLRKKLARHDRKWTDAKARTADQ